MRKKTRQGRKKRAKMRSDSGDYIHVTGHAIKRYQQRIKHSSDYNAEKSIIKGVRKSRLIALTKNEGREIRENRGIMFVCELQGRNLIVVTVLVGQVDMRFAS